MPDNEKKITILAVDDQSYILNMIKSMLKEKYQVVAATEHKSVFKILETRKPDLILLDIEMPEMDGYTLLGLIRELPAYIQTPIIFLTGNSEVISKRKELNINGYISKPFDIDTLCSEIESALEDTKQRLRIEK